METKPTDRYTARQKARSNGKYAKMHECEYCGRGLGVDYYSTRVNVDSCYDTKNYHRLVSQDGICVCPKCCEMIDKAFDFALEGQSIDALSEAGFEEFNKIRDRFFGCLFTNYSFVFLYNNLYEVSYNETTWQIKYGKTTLHIEDILGEALFWEVPNTPFVGYAYYSEMKFLKPIKK